MNTNPDTVPYKLPEPQSLDIVTEDLVDTKGDAFRGIGDNIVIVYAGGFESNGIEIKRSDDDGSVFDRKNLFKTRYATLKGFYEVEGAKGVYATGAISHGRDYKESSGGFVHGFRYTSQWIINDISNTLHKKSFPYRVFTKSDDLWTHLKSRVQTSSALWHLQAYYCDMVLHPPGESEVFLYVEQVPNAWELDVVGLNVLEDYHLKTGEGGKEAKRPDDNKQCVNKKSSGGSKGGDAWIKTVGGAIRDRLVASSSRSSLPYNLSKAIRKLLKDGKVKVNGKVVKKNDAKLYPGDSLSFDYSAEGEREKTYSLEIPGRISPGRLVVEFEYGEGFKGCDAVYDKGRVGKGFISPVIYLEEDHRLTPPSAGRGGKGSENMKKWSGWEKIVESEDLYARWMRPRYVKAAFDKYIETCKVFDEFGGSCEGPTELMKKVTPNPILENMDVSQPKFDIDNDVENANSMFGQL